MELQRDLKRRDLLRSVAMAGVGLGEMQAQEAIERATRGQSALRVKDLSVIATQPANVRLVVVKVTTDQAGLYGYGCATYTQRADLVVAAFEKYLKPFLLGKPADRIDDTWQALYNSSYWRNGPVLNNAISGVDQALWDIKGRQAGMPVYQLLGGKCREAADLYVGVGGRDTAEIIDGIRRAETAGYRHFRINVGRGDVSQVSQGTPFRAPNVLHSAPLFERSRYRGELRLPDGTLIKQ